MNVNEVVAFAKKNHLGSDDLYMEAELIEQEGAWLHMGLFGVGPKTLKKAAEQMEKNEKQKV